MGSLSSPKSYGRTANYLLKHAFDAATSKQSVEEDLASFRKLLDKGHYEEARAKLDQVRAIVPDDERVVEGDLLLWMPAA